MDNPTETAARLHSPRVSLVPLDDARPQDPVLRGTVVRIWYPGGTWRYGVRAARRHFVVDDPGCFAVGERVGILFAAGAPG